MVSKRGVKLGIRGEIGKKINQVIFFMATLNLETDPRTKIVFLIDLPHVAGW